ncbi:hypothetical protein [Agarivorans gilvus]|uniref:Uncharacterized protein n=1 Tax=Agarivorans gilvus TaxID=680279 RepID=A0ABQ1I022_9ALTE|nr:hypothetical protein [Agarivorans gilvus]GGA96007.1 hypothetical protein GCM10007414_06090 [Agarivorans gilvus]
MIIKIEKNADIVTYQYDDSVQGNIPDITSDTTTAASVANSLFAGLPTTGICTDTAPLDYTLYINLNAISEIRVLDNFDNMYALSNALTEGCTKVIVFGRGLQSTIIAFNKNSEHEYLRLKQEIDKAYSTAKE